MCLTQQEASQLGFGVAQAIQADAGSSLMADSQTALPDEFWIVDSCSLFGIDPNGAASFANALPSGIFICPAGTQTPNKRTAVGPDTAAVVIGLLMLPTDGSGAMWGDSQAGVTFIATHVTKQFIVPPGCFIRGIWDGGAGPLPANGSALQLNFTYVRRKVCS